MNDFNGALNESLDDFMESYKITDTEKIYSNGMELVPIFRVKQWFEYNNQDKEIERLHSIIKEVREYIMTELISEYDIENGGCVSGSDLPVVAITPILKILDKVDKEKNNG